MHLVSYKKVFKNVLLLAKCTTRTINPFKATYATSTSLEEVVIVSAVRTPIGSFQKSLSSISATDLGAAVVKETIQRSHIPDPAIIQELIFGNVLSSNLGQAPARQVVLKSTCLPVTTEATTINKVCASGLKSITIAATQMILGLNHVCVAGGMESMSNVPFYVNRGLQYGNSQILDGILRDGLLDPFEKVNYNHMGNFAEGTAKDYKISRKEQDDHALESYRRASEAWKNGLYRTEIVPITVKGKKGVNIIVDQDDEYKNIDHSKIPNLKAAFQKDGTVTAANSSKINDGAAAVLLMTSSKAKELNIKPIAKIKSFADSATEPKCFTIAPSIAIKLALARAALNLEDVHLWEINEAFSVVIRANEKILGLDSSKVNIRGGAVALGHPIGASGCRIVVTLLHALSSGQIGCAAICNGGGAATAMVIEKL